MTLALSTSLTVHSVTAGDVYKPTPGELTPAIYEGVVIDETGKPVSRAAVTSGRHFKKPTVFSDANGAFRIEAGPRTYLNDFLLATTDDGARMSTTVALKEAFGKK